MKFCGTKGNQLHHVNRTMAILNNHLSLGQLTSNGLNSCVVDFLCKEWLSEATNLNTTTNTAEYFLVQCLQDKRIFTVHYRDPVGNTKQGFSSSYATYTFEWRKDKAWILTDSHPGIMGE